MANTISDEAREVGRFVVKKVAGLQSAYLSDDRRSVSAGASLAQLRRTGSSGGRRWMIVGESLFGEMPTFSNLPYREKCAVDAASMAVRLYALHQQSKSEGMACINDEHSEGQKSRSFGWSCSRLSDQKKNGVLRRLAALEMASSNDAREHLLRGIVSLLKSEGVKVDYYQLARDLYLMQFSDRASGVFMRWSQDFYGAWSDKSSEE